MTRAREFLKIIFVLMTSLKGFLNIARVADGEFFFDNCHMDGLFLSLAVRKKTVKFYTYTLM